MDLAHGTVSSVIGKLGDLLYKEYDLLAGVRGDVEFLKNELTFINAFLKHLSVVEDPNELMRAWMKEVRELAYDIEDSIDLFLAYMGRQHRQVEDDDQSSDSESIKGRLRRKTRRRVRIIVVFLQRNKRWLMTVSARHRIANELRRLKVRTVEVAERRRRYDIQLTESKDGSAASRIDDSIMNTQIVIQDAKEKSSIFSIDDSIMNTQIGIDQDGKEKFKSVTVLSTPGGSQSTPTRRGIPSDGMLGFFSKRGSHGETSKLNNDSDKLKIKENNIFGIQVRKEELKSWILKKSHQDLRVLSIVGFGGIGKTTLAMELYNDVKSSFDKFAVVTVSQKYESKILLQRILKQILPEQTYE